MNKKEKKEKFCSSSFIFYASFYESIKELPSEIQVEVYNAIFEYALIGNEKKLDGIPKAIFALIKPQLEANKTRYINGCKGAESGKKGGAPKGNSNAKLGVEKNNGGVDFVDDVEKKNNPETTPKQPRNNPTGVNSNNPKTTPNKNDNVNENDNVNDIKERTTDVVLKKAFRFCPPTVLEVEEYCKERKNSVSAERFVNFYESKGWTVGKSPIKDWRASVRSWEGKDKEQPKPDGAKKYGDGSAYAFLDDEV